MPCTTDGGAAGTTALGTTTSNNVVTFVCVANTTDANCTHSNGEGQAYADCNDLLGTTGDASTYNTTMAEDAASAYDAANTVLHQITTADSCGEGLRTALNGSELIIWIYSAVTSGQAAGTDAAGTVYTTPWSLPAAPTTMPCLWTDASLTLSFVGPWN
jgi:hypothetical protein